MRKLLSMLLILLVSWGLMFSAAEAKRFGGGRSFGQSHSYSYSRPTSNSSGRNFGGGLIGGLILGGLLTSLFMGHGVAIGLLTWIAIFAGIFLLRNLLLGKHSNTSRFQPIDPRLKPTHNANFAGSTQTINEEEFLRAAKVLFMRLQAANDTKNIDDVIRFTTPEIAAEIQMQFQERGQESNVTEVLRLDAELVGVVSGELSVRFNGLIKESPNQNPAIFSEIWHFVKDSATNKWIVSGIQQN